MRRVLFFIIIVVISTACVCCLSDGNKHKEEFIVVKAILGFQAKEGEYGLLKEGDYGYIKVTIGDSDLNELMKIINASRTIPRHMKWLASLGPRYDMSSPAYFIILYYENNERVDMSFWERELRFTSPSGWRFLTEENKKKLFEIFLSIKLKAIEEAEANIDKNVSRQELAR